MKGWGRGPAVLAVFLLGGCGLLGDGASGGAPGGTPRGTLGGATERSQPSTVAAPLPPPPPPPMAAEENALARFRVLQDLVRDGLVPAAEFKKRRDANIGGLLPLTGPPMAEGVDRPALSARQIADRLKALDALVQSGDTAPADAKVEREAILDSLLPLTPAGTLPKPSLGLEELDHHLSLLAQARQRGILSDADYLRERLALKSAREAMARAAGIQSATLSPPGLTEPAPPPIPKKPARRAAKPKPPPAAPQAAAPPAEETTPPGPLGLHLGAYRSEAAAQRGWLKLKKAQFDLLGTLDYRVEKLELERGTYYRLKVGPALDAPTTKEICRKLIARKVQCQLTSLGTPGESPAGTPQPLTSPAPLSSLPGK